MYYNGEREQEKNSMGIWPILVEIVKKKKEHKKTNRKYYHVKAVADCLRASVR